MTDNIVNLDERRKLKDALNDDEVLCAVTIRADSRVTVFVSDRVASKEQWNWLFSHLATATAQVVDMEKETK